MFVLASIGVVAVYASTWLPSSLTVSGEGGGGTRTDGRAGAGGGL